MELGSPAGPPLQRKEDQKMQFHPEGHLIDTFENRASLQTPAALAEAMRDGKILEAKAVMCDSKHNLIVDLNFMRGIIPREEGAIGIKDGSVRDIAILSRVNRPVCFLIQDFTRDEYGRITALLSRRAAQEKCRSEFICSLCPGDVVDARVTHMSPLVFLQTSVAGSFPCCRLTPSLFPGLTIPGNDSWWVWTSGPW